MIMKEERKLLVEYGKKILDNGLTKATGGNLSIFNRKLNLMAITPSGLGYHETTEEDIVIMDLDKNIVEGHRVPSSEHQMHLIFYKNRTDIDAIIHAHTVYSTIIATLQQDLPACSYLVAFAGKDVKCAKYATYGSMELAQNAFDAMKDHKAVLLANHGILVGSADIHNSYVITEVIEHVSRIYVGASAIGTPVILDDAEMTKMLKKFETYGQVKK